MRISETLAEAAYRELAEEAGIHPEQVRLEQLRAYRDLGRDPRPERVVSALGADLPDPRPDTDADNAAWGPVQEALKRDLAFDHSQILADGIEWARVQLESTTLATAFCEPHFTLPSLRRVYEAVWDQPVDPRNLPRKALNADGFRFLVETGAVVRGRGRPAPLYARGQAPRLNPPIQRRQD